MSDLRAADARAPQRALEVGHSFIVQAPAGAGKTELLVRRFLALLATVDEPESILAITFTRKAAAEMRDRILGALRAVHSPDPTRPLHERTLELARAALDADRARGWKLLAQPGRLRIQTIDALNLGLARRLPLLSGLGAGLGVEEDARDLYRSAAERLLEQLPQGLPRDSAAVATLLAHLDNRVERFVELVIEMLARREAWLPVLPASRGRAPRTSIDLRQRLERRASGWCAVTSSRSSRAFRTPLLRDAGEVAAKRRGHLAAAGAGVRRSSRGRSRPHCPTMRSRARRCWQGLAQLLLKADGEPRVAFDARTGIPARARPARNSSGAQACWPRHSASTPRPCNCCTRVRELPPAATTTTEWRVLVAAVPGAAPRGRRARAGVRRAKRVADYPRFALRRRDSRSAARRRRPTRRSRSTPRCATCWSTSSRTPPRRRSSCSRR